MATFSISDRPIDRRALFGLAGIGIAALYVGAGSGEAEAKANFAFKLSESQWRERLGAKRFHILREAGTERPYSSDLNKEKRKGTFVCGGCGLPLFSSATKFESGTGWPSFYRPLKNAVVTESDRSLGIVRTEVLCRRCGGHLGHVFNDGPKPTGLRYCMNGLSMRFRAA